jgi:hypothetical protein
VLLSFSWVPAFSFSLFPCLRLPISPLLLHYLHVMTPYCWNHCRTRPFPNCFLRNPPRHCLHHQDLRNTVGLDLSKKDPLIIISCDWSDNSFWYLFSLEIACSWLLNSKALSKEFIILIARLHHCHFLHRNFIICLTKDGLKIIWGCYWIGRIERDYYLLTRRFIIRWQNVFSFLWYEC